MSSSKKPAPRSPPLLVVGGHVVTNERRLVRGITKHEHAQLAHKVAAILAEKMYYSPLKLISKQFAEYQEESATREFDMLKEIQRLKDKQSALKMEVGALKRCMDSQDALLDHHQLRLSCLGMRTTIALEGVRMDREVVEDDA